MVQPPPKPRRTIVVVPYDPRWAHDFADLRQVLAAAVGGLALTIEHVGSTSVPGLAAKPIIDIIIVLESRAVLPQVIEALAVVGYQHQGDQGVPGREAFRARQHPDVPRDGSGRIWPSHHLYVCAQDSREHRRHIVFRDYLRAHPDARDAYAALKRDLAQRFPHDIDSYTDGKRAFVGGIIQKTEPTLLWNALDGPSQ